MDRVDVMLEPVRALLFQIGAFLPRLALALAILVAGYLLAKAARFTVQKTLAAINFHIVTERADRVVAGPRVEGRLLERRHLGRRRPPLRDPLLARAVHQLHVVVPVVLEVPVRVGGEPVVAVAVEDDRVVVRDPAAAEQVAELVRAQEIALHLVLEVLLPVEADRAGNVRLRVQRGILVDLHDPDRAVAQVVLDPLGVNEHVFGVVGHRL